MAIREDRDIRDQADDGFPPSAKRLEEVCAVLCERVRVYVERRYNDSHFAEEITSDVFVRLWRARDKHDPSTLEWPFVRACIHNAICDRWRAEDRERERRPRVELPICTTPHDEFVQAECWRKVRKALAILPEHTRETFIAVDLKGIPIQVLAQHRGVGRKMVEKDLAFARKAVRTAIDG